MELAKKAQLLKFVNELQLGTEFTYTSLLAMIRAANLPSTIDKQTLQDVLAYDGDKCVQVDRSNGLNFIRVPENCANCMFAKSNFRQSVQCPNAFRKAS